MSNALETVIDRRMLSCGYKKIVPTSFEEHPVLLTYFILKIIRQLPKSSHVGPGTWHSVKYLLRSEELLQLVLPWLASSLLSEDTFE